MAEVHFDQQSIWLIGQVDFDNAAEVYEKGLAILKDLKAFPILVDLSELHQGNTLVLAILIQWLRKTPRINGLRLRAVPNKMLGILKASHLDHLLVDL